MTDITIKEFSKTVGLSVNRLIDQLELAGVKKKKESDLISNEEKIQKELILNSGKPSNIVDKILEGKMKKYFSEVTLLNQSYILDQDKTVRDMINQQSKYEYKLISFDLINL